MKYYIYTIFFLLLGFNSYSQYDSAIVKRIVSLENSIMSIQSTLTSINQKLNVNATVSTAITTPNNTSSQPKEPLELSAWQKFYAILPILFFLLIFFTLLIWLNKGGFNLADALRGEDPIEIKVPNPAATSGLLPGNTVPQTVSLSQVDPQTQQPVMPKSSSRFIALFSGMATIVFAICLVSYYVYFGMRGTPAPSFDNIFEAVLGLGIGVIPYAVNKFTQSNKP